MQVQVTLLPIQLPATLSGKAEEDGSISQATTTQVGNLDEPG